jgi:hypothetical protein
MGDEALPGVTLNAFDEKDDGFYRIFSCGSLFVFSIK